MILSLAIIFFSAYLIWKSSESFDIASSYLARNLNDGIKGPTINAIASSLPELLISFIFLFYIGDIEGFSAGYAVIIGSSIFNIAIIPTISFFIIFYKEGIPLFPTDKNIIQQDGLLLIITEIVLLMGLYFGGISIYLASTLIILYFIYIIIIFKKRNTTTLNCESKKNDKINLSGIKKNIIKCYLIGKKTNFFKKQIENKINFLITKNLKKTLIKIFKDIKLSSIKSNTILLSPAAASYDQFMNFEKRGEVFKKLSKQYARKFI